jgi:hypothetical protein
VGCYDPATIHGTRGMYLAYCEQFLHDCKIFDRSPLKRYVTPYAEALGLESRPFWKIVKLVIEHRKEDRV